MSKQVLLLRMGILVEVDKSDPDTMEHDAIQIEARIRDAIHEAIGCHEDGELGWCSTHPVFLEPEHVNCGQCAQCGNWITDLDAPEPILGLGRGARYQGRLLCDEHLPIHHRHAFVARPGVQDLGDGSRPHYAVRCRLDGVERFFIWYSAASDGVLLSSPERLALFADLGEVDQYASEHNLWLESEAPAFYDFDRLAEWLSWPSCDPDCRFLLDTWNMLADIARSLGTRLAEPPEADGTYDKLFRGCNLPSMTPPGEPFVPSWSEPEIATLTTVLSSGLQTLRGAVERVP